MSLTARGFGDIAQARTKGGLKFLYRMKILFTLVFSFYLISLSEAATYYVGTTGHDTNNDCTEAQNPATPKLTMPGVLACISTAVGGAAGTTVVLKNGSYPSFAVTHHSGSAGSPFVIQGESLGAVTIDSYIDGQSGSAAIDLDGGTGFNRVNYLTVRNLKVTDGNPQIDVHKNCDIVSNTTFCANILDTYNFKVRGIRLSAVSNITIENNEIYRNSSEGIVGNCSTGCQILNNIIHDNGAINSGYGMYLTAFANGVVRGNISYANAGMGYRFATPGGEFNDSIIENNIAYNMNRGPWWHDSGNFVAYNADGFLLYFGQRNIFRNSLSYNNGGVGINIWGIDNKIYNNSVFNNGGYNYYPRGILILVNDGGTPSSGNQVRNNIVYGTFGGIDIDNQGASTTIQNNLCTATGSNCSLSGNPQFVNAVTPDLRLQSSSPAINAGQSLSADVPLDFDGNPRPYGAAYDLGAFEFTSETTPSTTPAHHWAMNENGTTTTTSSPGGQACTFVATPVWVPGWTGSALDFETTDVDVLSCTTSHLISSNDWTVTARINLEANNIIRTIYYNGDQFTAGGRSGILFRVSDTDTLQLVIYTGTDAEDVIATTATISEAGVFTHVAARKNGLALNIFINGAVAASGTATSATMDYTANTLCTMIGGVNDGTTNQFTFDGVIDDVKVWTSALTDAQILADAGGVVARRRRMVVRLP